MNHQPTIQYARKRPRDKENDQSTEQQAPHPSFQTKLTEVNEDCLETIFLNLNLNDFLNIAHPNKELKTAADMAFTRKFGRKRFDLLSSK